MKAVVLSAGMGRRPWSYSQVPERLLEIRHRVSPYVWGVRKLVRARDLLSFVLWDYSFVGNTINCRGPRCRLAKGGRLIPRPMLRVARDR